MSEKIFDVIIIGAGPAGASAAIALSGSHLSVGLLDKARFPRDKTCGDALSVDVINQLKILSPALLSDFQQQSPKVSSYGVQIFAPDGSHIDIPFIHNGEKRCGYVCQRFDFDNGLVRYVRKLPNIEVVEGCEVTKVETVKDGVIIHTGNNTFNARMVIAADGAHSIVNKSLKLPKPDKKHYSAGLRVYYEGVTGFHNENFIELYFFSEILPGYLWIFPLPNNQANVGIGMLSSSISRKKINLKEVLKTLLTTHPSFQDRFKHAKALETVKGYGLPLGSKKRLLSGDRYLLTGDAASLIDPFTGEGIANAIRSGRIAGAHAIRCFEKNDFTARFNQQYDKEIYRRMWKELKLSRSLQRLCQFPALFNFVVRKANENKHVHDLLIDALAHADKKKAFTQPGFYYRLLFNK